MAKKLRVGVLFGGRSSQHEVSLLSAASVLKAIDTKKYDVVPIGITKQGHWLTAEHAEQLLGGEKSEPLAVPALPGGPHLRAGDPEATASATVLASGASVVMPPVPESGELMPFGQPRRRSSDRAINVDVIFNGAIRGAAARLTKGHQL